jgi:hypothetical protein
MADVTIAGQRAPVAIDCDVAVCGGGSAGLGAALSAAREGARVALIERWPFFGGNATAASLGSICGLYLRKGDDLSYLSGGIAREWAEALASRGQALGPLPYKATGVMLYSPWAYKRLADASVSAEPRIIPLLHSLISGVVRSGDDIEAVILSTKKGPLAVRAQVFVDATGDADIVFHAGCPWEMGEAGRLQYPSMQFYLQGADMGALAPELGRLGERMQAAMAAGTYRLTRSAGALIPTTRPGEIVGAMTRVSRPDGSPPDGTDVFDLTAMEMTGRDIVDEAARFLKAEMPGLDDAFLEDTAFSVGIRETRHAIGDHVISFDEAASCAKHADGVAASAWPFEFHTQGAETHWQDLPPGDWFEIPLRSLVAKGATNLLVAGRCISAEHEALASSRVTGVCMAIGEAAGVAAAWAASSGDPPRDLDAQKLRAELIGRGTLPSPA